MDRHVEDLRQRTTAHSESFDTVIIGGVGRDAEYIAQHLASRQRSGRSLVLAGERNHR
jgi:precorrin-6B methylase 2